MLMEVVVKLKLNILKCCEHIPSYGPSFKIWNWNNDHFLSSRKLWFGSLLCFTALILSSLPGSLLLSLGELHKSHSIYAWGFEEPQIILLFYLSSWSTTLLGLFLVYVLTLSLILSFIIVLSISRSDLFGLLLNDHKSHSRKYLCYLF